MWCWLPEGRAPPVILPILTIVAMAKRGARVCAQAEVRPRAIHLACACR